MKVLLQQEEVELLMVCADGGLLWCVGSVGYEVIESSSSGGGRVADGGLLWCVGSVGYEVIESSSSAGGGRVADGLC